MKRWNLIVIVSIFLTSVLVADAFAVIYYVNRATGINAPDRGLTAALPFKTIQYALAKPDATEIRIAKGTYTGPFNIPEFRKITLKGAGIEKTFLQGDKAGPVVSADGPTKVTLTALTIQNGTYGILAKMASVTGDSIRVWKNTGHGCLATKNSYLWLNESTVSTNGGHGVRIKESSAADIDNCTISSNTQHGIQVAYSSYASIMTNSISSNKYSGVQLWSGSSAWIQHNEIFSNTYDGVDVTGHSMGSFGGGNDIHSNGDNSGWRGGVGTRNGSQSGFSPEPGEDKDEIHDNNGLGIQVHNNSGALVMGASIFDNNGNGVAIGLSSSGQFSTGADIDNNSLYGVSCANGAFVGGSVGSISGNGSGATSCQGWTPLPTSIPEELQEQPDGP